MARKPGTGGGGGGKRPAPKLTFDGESIKGTYHKYAPKPEVKQSRMPMPTVNKFRK